MRVRIDSLFTQGFAPYTTSNFAGIFKERFSKKLTTRNSAQITELEKVKSYTSMSSEQKTTDFLVLDADHI